jgi:two-component system repressor protein LuxO
VRLAATGREALDMAVAFQPDIVVCDLNLPDISGLEVLGALQRNPAVGHALLVIHSAFQMAPECRQAPEADLFMSKPITHEKLAVLLSELHRSREKMRKRAKWGYPCH